MQKSMVGTRLVGTVLVGTALVAATPLLMLGRGAHAQTAASPITIEHVWARATAPGGSTGAVYLTIVDHGAPDRLIGAATPVAGSAELHETSMQGNVMRMRPVDGLAVTAQGPVTLAPGGYHLMLMGLKGPLRQGETFPLTVTFQKAGTIQVTVAVEGIGAGGPVKSGGAGHDMDMGMPMAPPPK